ncbi:ankyrin repeat and MYND domain-containing protein 1 isoform X2 [Archocentrus centrarchus]|uniref:ankyrin repeat and MYND domain-containing protein 1 isoform X2 n=1 Tax=Archocentrus centrarchus TaxID=63155 RepID=UPI0011EA0D13|nr:ankyrin repeat and MYND domain-containing protein 1 isoform X2 [Archocentrus centrarchus]
MSCCCTQVGSSYIQTENAPVKMLSTTCTGAAAGRGGAQPVTTPESDTQGNGRGGARFGKEICEGLGVQEWPDGSRYEGEFVNGFKHGKGRYSWANGEYYEGSFYKDYRHGDGLYCWPTGHKFSGKFYLNRKEGYGQQVFPDGATFQGLYHADQRFGPGVLKHPDGRQDVGLWLRERLLRLCTPLEEGFSLKNFPEYAACVDPSVTENSLTQPQFLSSGLQKQTRTDSEVDADRDLLPDETFILPPGMESYSTDGDHLPLPPGRRRELDRHFYGELWEPDTHPHQGYERDPLSTLPLQARMQAHIQKHRLQAENVSWDVEAILSMNREGFGPKGPLEVSSELLIHHSSKGDLRTVSQILQTGLVHPDVADSHGHTALIAATVNCHNDVIHLLLDMGADIDKLNCEGVSPLAVCHVLYYPFRSLHMTQAEPPVKTQVLRSPSGNGSPISEVDLSVDTSLINNLSDQRVEKLAEYISLHSSESSSDSELISEQCLGLDEPDIPANTEHLQEEERKEKGDDRHSEEMGRVRSNGSQRQTESRCDQRGECGESEVEGTEREFKGGKRKDEHGELVKSEELRKDYLEEEREEDEENVEDTEGEEERGSEDVSDVERSVQVLDGHIELGTVQWKEARAKGKDRDMTLKQPFESACSLSSYNIQVTDEVMQRSAEALSRTGISRHCDTQETVRKMAAMKIEHRARLDTLKLLLDRGADPNAARVPMPVLFLAIMAADTEAVRKLLLCGARTDIHLPPEKKGLYPLHVAAALPGPAGPRITELLLHAITDPDVQACDQDEIYEPDRIFMKAAEMLNTSQHLKEGGRTALHVACQRESDYRNASKVVTILLSHRASTDLLWSGHSPLSLAIASGNDMAVEQLLNGGADPNIPLGWRVGSALCALANINYHLVGDKIKLLDTLAKAGADILMPVTVCDVVGTAVDYAHYSFKQDSYIANTPFHALSIREREIFKARRKLLSTMEDLLRQAAVQRGTGGISSNKPLPSSKSLQEETGDLRKAVLKFCYHCSRSASVSLTPCGRCHKVFYCSRTCKLNSWEERHKKECVRVSASAGCSQKSAALKPQRSTRPLSAILKSKTTPRPSTVKFKSERELKLLSTTEKDLESNVKLKENYSYN